jgi:hypothetical protein
MHGKQNIQNQIASSNAAVDKRASLDIARFVLEKTHKTTS